MVLRKKPRTTTLSKSPMRGKTPSLKPIKTTTYPGHGVFSSALRLSLAMSRAGPTRLFVN